MSSFVNCSSLNLNQESVLKDKKPIFFKEKNLFFKENSLGLNNHKEKTNLIGKIKIIKKYSNSCPKNIHIICTKIEISNERSNSYTNFKNQKLNSFETKKNYFIKKNNIKNINEINDIKKKYKENNRINIIKNNFDKEFKLIGLENIGHSCFMNSFLQILLRTPSFFYYLKKYFDENNSKHSLLECLISLSDRSKQEICLKKIKTIISEEDGSFAENMQNDSQEFGIALINKIISIIKKESSFSDDDDDDDNYEETPKQINYSELEKYENIAFNDYINKYHKKEDETLLEKMFQFHESSVKIGIDNQIKDVCFETFLNIELTFPTNGQYDLEDILKLKYRPPIDLYLELDKILENIKNEKKNISIKSENEQEKIISENESGKEKQKKMDDKLNREQKEEEKSLTEFIIKKIFEILEKIKQWWNSFSYFFLDENIENYKNNTKMLSLKNLASLPNVLIISINRALLGKSLNNSLLKFKEILDISNYINEFILKKENNKNTIYKLYGINECYGFFKNHGHYYSYVKVRNIWYKFDDRNFYKETPKLESKYVVGLYYIKEDFIQNEFNYSN